MKNLILVITAAFVASGCTAHRIDIQQGNVITREAVEKLKPGMDKRQVSVLIGTPMITDPFHAERWDYLYRLDRQGRLEHFSHITLYFDQDMLARIDVHAEPLPEETLRSTAPLRDQDRQRKN